MFVDSIRKTPGNWGYVFYDLHSFHSFQSFDSFLSLVSFHSLISLYKYTNWDSRVTNILITICWWYCKFSSGDNSTSNPVSPFSPFSPFSPLSPTSPCIWSHYMNIHIFPCTSLPLQTFLFIHVNLTWTMPSSPSIFLYVHVTHYLTGVDIGECFRYCSTSMVALVSVKASYFAALQNLWVRLWVSISALWVYVIMGQLFTPQLKLQIEVW